MKFDELVDYYSGPETVKEAKRGRPKKAIPLIKPSDGAFDMGFPTGSVENQIIQYVDETPATSEELVTYLRSNFDEYHSKAIAKEKIRQMLLDEILQFSSGVTGARDEEEVPALDFDTSDEFEPNLSDYLEPGAYDDYQQSSGGGNEYF